jgi:glycosyltransferase involved in cell wall biosynthesis
MSDTSTTVRTTTATDDGGAGARTMRVLLVIDELDLGGTEQQILELVRHLPRARWTPVVCCFRPGRKAAEIARLGVRVVHLPKRARVDPLLVRDLISLMRAERFDVVQTFLIGGNLWGRIAAIVAGVPVVIASERNVDVWEEPLKRWLGLALARLTDRIVANADAVRDYLVRRGADPARVVTIRNGVDFGRFATPIDREGIRRSLGFGPEHTVAAVVARLEPQKGHDIVLEVASRLRDGVPALRWLLVGGGGAEEELRAEAARRNLSDRVVFTGFRTDSADLLRAADLSVLTSTKEGLSNTLLESLVAGLPVIASRVGGNAEVVAAGAGLLVPPRDAKALAAAVELVAADPVGAGRMGARGREHVRRAFGVGRMVEETAALYDELLGLPVRRPAQGVADEPSLLEATP